MSQSSRARGSHASPPPHSPTRPQPLPQGPSFAPRGTVGNWGSIQWRLPPGAALHLRLWWKCAVSPRVGDLIQHVIVISQLPASTPQPASGMSSALQGAWKPSELSNLTKVTETFDEARNSIHLLLCPGLHPLWPELWAATHPEVSVCWVSLTL